MLESVLAIPFWIEFAGTITGALAGAIAGVRAEYDIFGTTVLACVTGLGGGIIRDILLQDYGIYAFQHPILLLACAVAGGLVFYFHKLADAFDWVMDFLDNLSVGLWAVVSVGKGLSAGLAMIPSIILGTITAVGGGISRDVLMAQRPVAFQAGTLYGTASLFGSTAFALMKQNDVLGDYAAITCVVLVMAIRYASEFFGWRTKPAQDYSDKVIVPVKKVAHVAARPVKKVVRNAVDKRIVSSPEPQLPHHEKAAHRIRLRAEAQARMAQSINAGASASPSKAAQVTGEYAPHREPASTSRSNQQTPKE